MTFHTYGNPGNPRLLLIPGLGVSHEIFLPLIGLLKDKYDIVIDHAILDAAPLHPLPRMNHGQLLVDHPDEIAARIQRLF